MKRWKTMIAAVVLCSACSVQQPPDNRQRAADGTITEELQTMFDEACEGLIGVRYIPEELMEAQIISGTNYRFLCEKQNIGMILDTSKQYAIVTVYVDPDGNAEIVDIEEKQDD